MSDRTSTSWDPTVLTADTQIIRYPVTDAIRLGRMIEMADRLAADETPCYYLEVRAWMLYINGEADAAPAPGYGRHEAYGLHPSNDRAVA